MATTKWVIDPTHSEIGFKVKHMMFSNVSGKFESFTAEATIEDEDFNNASFEFSADASSVNTGNADRDNHLKTGDFFGTDEHGKITFRSTSFTGSGDEYQLKGDLTIRGISKPVTLDVEFGGIAKDPWGNTKAGFSATGKINRKDFGISWNAALEAGGVLVSDEVKLAIDVQFVKQ